MSVKRIIITFLAAVLFLLQFSVSMSQMARRSLLSARKRPLLVLVPLLLILGVGISVLVMSWTRGSFTRPGTSSDSTSSPAEFVDDQLCADCHQRQYQEWLRSHHDLAMQKADGETVLGNFDDTRFVHCR